MMICVINVNFVIIITRFNVDCSLAESHYAKNEGLFAGGSGGGHPIGGDDSDDNDDGFGFWV